MSAKQAYREWQDRQDRNSHPDGKFDNGGRWFPSDQEFQSCCRKIRNPSRAYPYSLMTHCRTARHVANLYNVSVKQMKDAGQ